jgi:hypothetical protein
VHDGLVGLVLEVAIPSGSELWEWPTVHFPEFLLRRADLDAGLNAVGSKRASAVDLPLLEDPGLGRWVAAGEVVERLCAWLGTVDGEGEVVVLEVETNTRKVDEWLDASLAELVRVTDTRSLEDKRRRQRATRDDNLSKLVYLLPTT